MNHVSQKLRDSAKGEECTFNIAGVCSYDNTQTVLCHAPTEWKGHANKSPDYCAAFGCYACHNALDGHKIARDERNFYWMRAQQRTWKFWVEKGLIFVVGIDLNKPKSTKPRKSKMRKTGQKIQSNKTISSRPFQKRRTGEPV